MIICQEYYYFNFNYSEKIEWKIIKLKLLKNQRR